jgi:potassium/hydrogen antiporter
VTREVITQLGLLLGAALAARFIAGLLKVPEMLVLVAVGLLLSGVIDVPLDSTGAQLLFTLGVSMILFYGGLNLSLPVLRRVWVSLGLLVVPGVVLTAVVTGVAAYAVFDLSWTAALLLGAVLAPTDPAILIPLFIRSRLRKKVSQTVVAESAFNDPTGAALALALAGVLLSGESGMLEPAAEFVVDLAISSVLGIAAGVLLALTISSRRVGIWDESAGLAVLAVVAIAYVSLDSAGGSGYLGAFLAGLIVGNMEHLRLGMHSEHEDDMRRFAANLSDLATLLVFVVLGANIPLDDLADHLLPALAVLAMLLLVARPLTVLACVLPDRGGGWTWREIAFLCWTRETGVVPAALVGVIVGLGVPNGDIYASVVALAIVVTLLLQALPAPWLAGRLGLLDDEVRTAAGTDPLPTE